jgi:hypothetical protein
VERALWIDFREVVTPQCQTLGYASAGRRAAFAPGAESLEPISWEELVRGFEENELAFVHQDETAEVTESRFSKLVKR